ncbi:MAG: DUF3857 domain-containing protein [Terriglobales bacterium]
MNDVTFAPGSSAVVLDWETFTDDNKSYETVYFRIKVLNQEGTKYGDIQIPYLKESITVKDIQARTIQPDGRVIPFTGPIYDSTIAKTRGFRYLAKTFTLPEVQKGSILEYRYRLEWQSQLFSSHWVSEYKFPLRHARFVIRPYNGPYMGLAWRARGLPVDKSLIKQADGSYAIEFNDQPAFVEEKYSPPEDELKSGVELFYTDAALGDPDKFWKAIAASGAADTEKYVGNRGYIRDLAASLAAPGDTAEVKLRKFYARAQQIRNLSYERDRTDEEWQREKLKTNENVEDVFKHAYGWYNQINLGFMALAKAAGFEVHEVTVASRDQHFFRKEMEDASQLNGHTVEVVAEGKTYYLAPGILHCPFGLLPWFYTGVMGLRTDKNVATFITTPNPVSDRALTERKAQVHLADEGLKGELVVIYHDQDALMKRLELQDEDDASRKKALEDEAKDWLPVGSVAKITALQAFDGTEEPLVAKFSIEVPGIGSSTPKRKILPLDIFNAGYYSAFQKSTRKHPIYFSYPYQEFDQVLLEMPTGYKVDVLPQGTKELGQIGRYASAWRQDGRFLVFQRRMALDWFFFDPEKFSDIKNFFSKVRRSDQESAVLHAEN